MAREFWQSKTPPKRAGDHPTHKGADAGPYGNPERNNAVKEYDTASKRLNTEGATYRPSNPPLSKSLITDAIFDPIGTADKALSVVTGATARKQKARDDRFVDSYTDASNAETNLHLIDRASKKKKGR